MDATRKNKARNLTGIGAIVYFCPLMQEVFATALPVPFDVVHDVDNGVVGTAVKQDAESRAVFVLAIKPVFGLYIHHALRFVCIRPRDNLHFSVLGLVDFCSAGQLVVPHSRIPLIVVHDGNIVGNLVLRLLASVIVESQLVSVIFLKKFGVCVTECFPRIPLVGESAFQQLLDLFKNGGRRTPVGFNELEFFFREAKGLEAFRCLCEANFIKCTRSEHPQTVFL